jgi:hypothetical protein
MTASHGRADWYGAVGSGSGTRTIGNRGPARPSRRAESHHYLAVIAAEVHRMARELGSTSQTLGTRSVG